MIILNAKNYCESTSIHGFSYWVSADNVFEKLFWVLTVVIGFSCASAIISHAVQGWVDQPGVTEIGTFSKVFSTRIFQFSLVPLFILDAASDRGTLPISDSV